MEAGRHPLVDFRGPFGHLKVIFIYFLFI